MLQRSVIRERIVRVLQGRASEAELEELEEWRRTSARIDRYYHELAHVWVLSERPEPDIVTAAPSGVELLTRAVGRRSGEVRRLRRRSTRNRVWAAVAAGVMLTLGFGLGHFRRTTVDPLSGPTELKTGASEMTTVKLGDGSVIRLAPKSVLRFWPEAPTREAWLEGRAFFGVAHRPDDPFTVHTPRGDAIVLGTRFDLDARRGTLRLVVVDGRVMVATDRGRVEVRDGEMGIVAADKQPSVIRVDSVHALLGWMGQTLIFGSTPLREALAEVTQRYGVPVELRDSALARRTVTASFTDQTFEEVFAIVCRIVGAQCTLREEVAVMDAR